MIFAPNSPPGRLPSARENAFRAWAAGARPMGGLFMKRSYETLSFNFFRKEPVFLRRALYLRFNVCYNGTRTEIYVKAGIDMELKGCKINLLGDSITCGVGTSAPEKRFGDLIAAQYGAIVRNYGISGTRIARQRIPTAGNPEFDRHFVSRVPDMDADADVIVVFGGTNDFGHGDAPIGNMSDRKDTTFCGGLHALYTALIEKYPDARIVILTPTHRLNEDNPRGDGNKPQDVGRLIDYVNFIREAAEFYSLPVLDLFAVSGIQPRVSVLQQRYMPDGLHPNDAGHARLAAILASFLKAL